MPLRIYPDQLFPNPPKDAILVHFAPYYGYRAEKLNISPAKVRQIAGQIAEFRRENPDIAEIPLKNSLDKAAPEGVSIYDNLDPLCMEYSGKIAENLQVLPNKYNYPLADGSRGKSGKSKKIIRKYRKIKPADRMRLYMGRYDIDSPPKGVKEVKYLLARFSSAGGEWPDNSLQKVGDELAPPSGIAEHFADDAAAIAGRHIVKYVLINYLILAGYSREAIIDWLLEKVGYCVNHWIAVAELADSSLTKSTTVKKMAGIKPGEWQKVWDEMYKRHKEEKPNHFSAFLA